MNAFEDVSAMPKHWTQRECVIAFFKGYAGPFRSYKNPQRDDGVFIGQDRAINPEENYRKVNGCINYTKEKIGEPVYPPAPTHARVYPTQLSHEEAAAVLEILNKDHVEGPCRK